MNKRILVTSTDMMMIQFLVPHIISLSENGYEVEIACSEVGARMDDVRQKLSDYVQHIHVVRLVRSPLSARNFKGYADMKAVIEQGNYDIIWTNEPVMGVVTRLAARNARKNGTKVLYMVHGFHFYKGASVLNWLIYYPIEKLMARFCDMIATVNLEDYKRARELKVKEVKYIHGIGINPNRLVEVDSIDIHSELHLAETDFLVLSIGELNTNKDQKTIINAIHRLKDTDIHYLICGKGSELKNLQELVSKYQLEGQVHFLGYRKDILNICHQSDVFVLSSHREGLPVASLEAMYSGLPLVTSNIRGLVDIMEDDISGYLCEPGDEKAFAEAIRKLKENLSLRKKMGENNKQTVRPYCIENTIQEVQSILNNI